MQNSKLWSEKSNLLKILVALTRMLTGGVFLYSGWNKLTHPLQEFQFIIEQYKIFSSQIAEIISHAVPWIEFIFGSFLVIGFLRKQSARVLSVLCLGFIALLASTIVRKIDLANCGCFGEGIHLSPVQALTLDFVLFISLLFFSRPSSKSFELDSLIEKT